MSKLLVGIHNNLDQPIVLNKWDNSKHWTHTYPPGHWVLAATDDEFNVPDNSDPEKYWDTNRVEIQFPNGEKISFWDDDSDDYVIKFYPGDQAPKPGKALRMRGGHQGGGDGTRVVLHVSTRQGREQLHNELTAVALTKGEQRKQMASHFQTFVASTGLSPRTALPPEKAQEYLTHSNPDYKTLAESALSLGFKSLGLVWGGNASLIVGGEVMSGILTDTAGSVSYAMQSSAVTLGAEEGVVAFVGLYLSDEEVQEVGGLEFFWEIGADIGMGVALRVFTTLSGSAGLVVFLTTGEELELSVGMGETTTQKL